MLALESSWFVLALICCATCQWSSIPNPTTDFNNALMQSMAYSMLPMLANNNAEIQPLTALQMPQQPWMTYSPGQSLYNPYGATMDTCSQCNGDCRNFLCYGCGGCVEPTASQQPYYNSYQRPGPVRHDAFLGNEMALSGMIIYPAPKLPWLKAKKHRALAARSRQYTNKEKNEDRDDDDHEED